MTKKCLVWWCRNKVRTPGVHFFSLPKLKERRALWLKAMGRDPNSELSKSVVVCSSHFIETDFIKLTKRVHLKENTVPTRMKKEIDVKPKPPSSDCSVTKNIPHDVNEIHNNNFKLSTAFQENRNISWKTEIVPQQENMLKPVYGEFETIYFPHVDTAFL